MKKLIYIVWAFCLGLQGCEQDPESEYDDIDRISSTRFRIALGIM